MKKNEKQSVPQRINFLAGGIAGATATIITQPLDVIKTRMQSFNQLDSIKSSQGHKFFTKTFTQLKVTAQREGVKGLYRGLVPNVMGITPSRALYFSGYNASKNFLVSTKLFNENTSIVPMLSAASASILVYSIMNPVWLVKTRLQLQEVGHKRDGSPNYNGYVDCVRRVFKEEGIRGFYKGLTASFMGVFESAIYFVIYEKLKLKINERNGNFNDEFTAFEYISMAGFSKFVASVLTYPHEVVRTRMREIVNGKCPYDNLYHAFKTIAKEEGRAGLYRGMAVHLSRTVPNTAIMFFVYEFVVNLWKNSNNSE